MGAETEAYKEFVDGLAKDQGSMAYILSAFLEKRWNYPSSRLLNDLPGEVREAIPDVIYKAAETAVHDVLVCMTDKEYLISRAGVTLPVRPFDNALYDDFVARVEGLPWPQEEQQREELGTMPSGNWARVRGRNAHKRAIYLIMRP